MSAMPASTNRLASLTFWQHIPTAPSAIWRNAISGHLWLLAWGRKRTLAPIKASIINFRLCSNASRSRISAGVSIASRRFPTAAAIHGLIEKLLVKNRLLVNDFFQKALRPLGSLG